MHLALMTSDELLDNTLSSGGEGKLGYEQTTHELGKDSMLEKIVLVSVAYFCIATEMRFIMANKNLPPSKSGQNITKHGGGNLPGGQWFNKQDSEAFHA
jgi:hypothetical protein